MKLAVFGFGTIGRSVCKLLDASADFEVKWILELPQFCTQPKMTSSLETILEDPEVEAVCDLLPGIHPSYEYMKAALTAGKHVVTSNKAALCFGFAELMALAAEKQLYLRYEAACGGTIPDIAEALKLSRTNEITGLYGIMNGTTNFMIDKMSREGREFDDVLKEAQALGYAERNPQADLSGFDVQNKTVILSNTAYGCLCDSDFPVCGIEKLTKDILDGFKRQGKTLKLLGMSVKKDGEVALGVAPVVLDGDSLEAHVPLNFNLFTLIGDKCGVIKLYGQGAGGIPTADAVLRDLEAVRAQEDPGLTKGFTGTLRKNDALLQGTGYIGGETYRGSLKELAALAKEKDAFLAFAPEGLLD